jgi:hypothetical protein
MDNELISVEDRLKAAISVVEDYHEEELDAEELASIAQDINLHPKNYRKLAGTITYIRKRTIDRLSQTESFKIAFPSRCVNEDGEELAETTILTKARRLEASELYRQVFMIVSAPLHVAYAYDRINVVEKALEISLDDTVNPRDRHQYMRIFLEETRKPENLKGMEVNVNLTQNNVSIARVEKRLGEIAEQFTQLGASATDVIDTMVIKESEKAESTVVE